MPHQRLIQNSIVLVVIFALVFVLWRGYSAGKDSAQSKTILQNIAGLQQGLDYFYKDQNRYPSLTEFSDTVLMDNYFNKFPPQEFITEVCTPTYSYNTYRQLAYELSFCLPRTTGTHLKGKNRVTEKSAF